MQLYKLYEPYELYKLNRIFAYQSIETMKSYTRNIVIGLCVALAACSFSRGKKAEQGAARVQAFRLPEIPSIYTDEREQVKYLVARYWEHFDFADTSLIRRPEITEQAFANYLQLFPRVPYADVERAIASMLDRAMDADSVMFAHFTSLYEKYLYDPNSPMLSEEFYIPVLRYIVASPRVGEVDKLRPAFRLEMALKNRPGSAATDFVYTLPSGKREKLSDIRADYTILFFNNPDCDACRAIKAEFEAADFVNFLLREKRGESRRLVFLSVYPDPDVEAWRRHLKEQPKSWVCAYDDGQVIKEQRLYDLRAIPTFYLLDRDKKIIFKDVPFRVIASFLEQ